MRFKNLILGEFHFLYRYGIIFLYLIFTAVYLCLLAAIPRSARELTAIVLVFTDPAAMGLFFMGAVVLFEKSQRVESSLSVSPVKIHEYIVAKVVPLMIVGIVVSLVLCIFAGLPRLLPIAFAVALSSVLFSLCGLLVASNISSLNSFIITTVPFELLICAPALLYLFGEFKSPLWIINPGVAAIQLIRGEGGYMLLSVLSLIIWIALIYCFCKRAVTKAFRSMGGAKL